MTTRACEACCSARYAITLDLVKAKASKGGVCSRAHRVTLLLLLLECDIREKRVLAKRESRLTLSPLLPVRPCCASDVEERLRVLSATGRRRRRRRVSVRPQK
jgi:hypothetical protein